MKVSLVVLMVFGLAMVVGLHGIEAGAATYYVDKSYGDGGNGSESQPFDTIIEAVNVVMPGSPSTVYIAPGMYEESLVINKYVTLIGESPELTRIVGGGIAVDVMADAQVTLQALQITASGRGVYVRQRAWFEMNNVVVVGCGQDGVYVYAPGTGVDAPNVYIVNCTIDRNGSSGNAGIWVFQKSTYTEEQGHANVYVFNSLVTRNGNYGFYFYSNTSSRGDRVISHCDSWLNTTTKSNNYYNCSPGNCCIPEYDKDLGVDPKYVDPETGDYHLQDTSPARNFGNPTVTYNDPDGTRNDMGAYGGPNSAGFFPDPDGGPIVTDLVVSPPSVPQGGTFTIQATGQVR